MDMPQIRLPRARLAAILCAILGCNGAARGQSMVTVCTDDLVPGTLRAAVAAAADGDVIDVSACSKITLAHGELATSHSITIKGPATGRQTMIDGDGKSRILHGTYAGATLTLSGVTLANGNVFAPAGNAYGGCVLTPGTLLLQRSIVTRCGAVSMSGYAVGGAIYSGKLVLENSRVAYGVARAYGAHNLVSKIRTAMPPDTLVGNPRLTPLALRGGPLRTHGLSLSSPAIDHGSNVDGLAVDERGAGFLRVVGARTDIGAFERQADDDELFYGGFE